MLEVYVNGQFVKVPADIRRMPDDAVLTTGQVSEATGISKVCLQVRRHRGMAPAFHRVGRTVVYRAGDLKGWNYERQ